VLDGEIESLLESWRRLTEVVRTLGRLGEVPFDARTLVAVAVSQERIEESRRICESFVADRQEYLREQTDRDALTLREYLYAHL